MRAKVRAHNMTPAFRETLDKEARAYFDSRVSEYARRLQVMLVRRWLNATALALNDQHGFGARRVKRLIDGIIEIMLGNCDDVYDKGEIDKPGADKAAEAMEAELRERGIIMVITVNGSEIAAEIMDKKEAR